MSAVQGGTFSSQEINRICAELESCSGSKPDLWACTPEKVRCVGFPCSNWTKWWGTVSVLMTHWPRTMLLLAGIINKKECRRQKGDSFHMWCFKISSGCFSLYCRVYARPAQLTCVILFNSIWTETLAQLRSPRDYASFCPFCMGLYANSQSDNTKYLKCIKLIFSPFSSQFFSIILGLLQFVLKKKVLSKALKNVLEK